MAFDYSAELALAFLVTKPTHLRAALSKVPEFGVGNTYDPNNSKYKPELLSQSLTDPLTKVFERMYRDAFGKEEEGAAIAKKVFASQKLVNLLFAAWSNQTAIFALEPIWLRASANYSGTGGHPGYKNAGLIFAQMIKLDLDPGNDKGKGHKN